MVHGTSGLIGGQVRGLDGRVRGQVGPWSEGVGSMGQSIYGLE